MNAIVEDRRTFLARAGIAFALPLVVGCRTGFSAHPTDDTILAQLKRNAINDPKNVWWGAIDAPDNVGSKTVLAGSSDPGERIRIAGTIYRADGKTPAATTLIYLYHTDVEGIYGRGNEHRHGRYRGWMLTDKDGRFEFSSILPASYPNSTVTKHVHMTVTTKDAREDWVDSILFEGDRFLKPEQHRPERGGFDPVLKLEKRSDGVLYGVRNIILQA